MTHNEKTVSLHMGQRFLRCRLRQGLQAQVMAWRLGIRRSSYRELETGMRAITLDHLLRFQIGNGLDIERLWFPVDSHAPRVHDDMIRACLKRSRMESRLPTVRELLEITAEAFQVPCRALTEGLGHRRLVQARTAAAIVAAGHPAMKLADVARAVRRTSDSLQSHCYKARRTTDEGFWAKVEAIQKEVECL